MVKRKDVTSNHKADCANGFTLEEMNVNHVYPGFVGFKKNTPMTVYEGWMRPNVTTEEKKNLVCKFHTF